MMEKHWADQIPQSSTPSSGDVKVPLQVDVAFDVVRWANNIETGQGGDGRELYGNERAVYEAALEVLRLYLTGEMTFGDQEDFSCEHPVPEPPAQEDVKTSLDISD